MTERVTTGGLQVAKELYDLVADEIAPGTGVDPAHFWQELADICTDLVPRNQALLKAVSYTHLTLPTTPYV